jgi:2',3'-cyclic-nucleotide 2'-phosphodiesterase (5'-nucleotidase family)
LDCGDALIGGGLLGDATRGEAIVAGMNLMGYDAMAIGPNELSLGLETLRRRLAEAEFPMLSANVVLAGSGELLAQPYAILEVGGHRMGVIGLTRMPKEPVPGFEVLGLQQALARYVPEVAEQADTVIVLTNTRYRAAMKIVGAVPGADLLITGLPGQLPQSAVRIPKVGTLVVTAEQPVARHTGRLVGRLEVRLGGDGSLSGETWTTTWMAKTIADDFEMVALLAGYQK